MHEKGRSTGGQNRSEGANAPRPAASPGAPAHWSSNTSPATNRSAQSQGTPSASPRASATSPGGQTAPLNATEPAPLWLRRTDQAVVAGLVVAMLLLATIQLARVGWWRGEAIEIERLPASWYEYKIDVNRATWVEWTQLEGIGETLARRIIEDRETRGPFQNVEDVQRVKGIGPKKLEQIRRHLYTQSKQ